jgi:hypothetical protein
MSRLRALIVAVIGLVIVYVFISQAMAMGVPNLFVYMGVLMAVLIVLNMGRSLLRGY